MQVTLNQKEIEHGIRLFLESTGMKLTFKTLDIDFTAKRNDSGLTAAVDIEPDDKLLSSFLDTVFLLPDEATVQPAKAEPEAEAVQEPKEEQQPKEEKPEEVLNELKETLNTETEHSFDLDEAKEDDTIKAEEEVEVETAEAEPEVKPLHKNLFK